MGLLSLCFFQVILFAALEAKVGMHFHRYMLSDYKPQHNPKTQRDYYRRYPQNTIQERDGSYNFQRTIPKADHNHEIESKFHGIALEPLVRLSQSRKTVKLHQLIVRIYQYNYFICVGTQISELLVVTAASCFDGKSSDLVKVRTFDLETIPGHRMNKNESIAQSEDSQLAVVVLNRHPQSSVLKDDFVQLCNSRLRENTIIDMTIWIRLISTIQTWHAKILPLHECQYLLKDHQRALSPNTTVCVKNINYTPTCHRGIGNPISYNKMLCGVNLSGQNCQKITGVVLYSTLYDVNDSEMIGNDMKRMFDIEESIL